MALVKDLNDTRFRKAQVEQELEKTQEKLKAAEDELTHLRRIVAREAGDLLDTVQNERSVHRSDGYNPSLLRKHVTTAAGNLLDTARRGLSGIPRHSRLVRRLNLIPQTPRRSMPADWILTTRSPSRGPVEEEDDLGELEDYLTITAHENRPPSPPFSLAY
ncbi:hypothetical protein AAF712_010539 [Marasmius tenuissimus]|uniref:Uncharacterized protein n=1 Tax=Marasmius tenuissimus TaxID=585030 RepID=A0ABR2ZMQ9_9AGAR